MTSDPERAHLIGISGNGMFPLALLMREAGFSVTGSDARLPPERAAALSAKGIACWETRPHQSLPPYIGEAGFVVASAAIPRHHPELRAARQSNCVVRSRADALSRLIDHRETVCIAGSHGKSTVTAMLMAILTADRDERFGYMIGAEGAAPLPARLSKDASLFVLEACEAHGALAAWQPVHAIVTNIDDDHSDHYPPNGGLKDAFLQFLRRVPEQGTIIACGDDPGVASLLPHLARPVLSFGFSPTNRLRATPSDGGIEIILDGTVLGSVTLRVPGEHNLRNALAAIAMGMALRIPAATSIAALAGFTGITRRLQRIDSGSGPRLFDDFAHHPSEIDAALSALRPSTQARLIAVLEPQLNSRVTRLASAFAATLKKADIRIVMPVAGDGEQSKGEGGDAALAAACAAAGIDILHAASAVDLNRMIGSLATASDTIVVMSGRLGLSPAFALREILDAASANQTVQPTENRTSEQSVLFGRTTENIPDILATILAHARRDPDAPAVEMGTRKLSYAQLISRAGALAAKLSASGMRPGDTMAVCLPRSFDRITALVAALSIGAIYLPLDPKLPRSRLDQMLDDSGAQAIVVNAASPALSTGHRAVISCEFITTAPLQPAIEPQQASLADAIYTSGTTGRPKAVQVRRHALSNYAASAVRTFEIQSSSRVSLVSAFGFDVSIGDMVMAMAAGACIVIPTDLEAQPGNPLARFINRAELTHLSLTPSLLSAIPNANSLKLKAIIVAGEPCPQALVDRWSGERLFFNAYGPAEATVEVTIARCRPRCSVTVGTPIDNVGICILNDDLRPTTLGTEGEVCIFGEALAEGYHGLPDLTESRFPTLAEADWHKAANSLRVYRTGDRGFIDQEGQLCLTGRLDEQIKLNGFRIELAEIESVICQQPGILDACVSLMHGQKLKNRLVAHVVPDPKGSSFDPERLSQQLEEILPHYMLPSLFLPVQAIPSSLNGKRDRSALPIPGILETPRKKRRAKSATEQKLTDLLIPYLDDIPAIGRRKSLSRLGLDSLSMANFLMEIEEQFGVSLDMILAPGADTVEALALMVEARTGEPRHLASPDAMASMVRRMLPLLATWPGLPAGQYSLARCMPDMHGETSLFWVFQRGEEFEALAGALMDDSVQLFGLRSGDRILDYRSEDLPTITRLYADEIETIAPSGRINLGGNCQGGMMTRHIAIELARRNRDIGLVILMEQGRFSPLNMPVLLLFGERSYLNPYAQMKNPDQLFRLAYSDSYHVEMIPGGHGEYFLPINIGGLAVAVRRHLLPHQACEAERAP